MRRGLTLVEVLIAIVVLTVGLLVIAGSFTSNLRQSSQSRERLLAHLVLENLTEEVLAHPYGTPAPEEWNATNIPFRFIVHGIPQESEFSHTVSTSARGGNGSFLGETTTPHHFDTVTLRVDWTESTGLGNSAQAQSLEVDLLVRREI